MAKTLEFFFDFGSSYSYLASTQVEAIAQRTGAKLLWRPFVLGAVFKATQNGGPQAQPLRLQYIMKDCADWSAFYGVPFVLPDPFPFRSIDALRFALVADESGALPAFAHHLFHALWGQGGSVTPDLLRAGCQAARIDPVATAERAESEPIKERLRKNTDEALERGVFGAPTFFVEREDMYFGNDRLPFVERALTR